MSLPNEFLMRVAFGPKCLFYLRRADANSYRLRDAACTDEEAEERDEFPYWNAETVEQYINEGSWLLVEDLDEPASEVKVDLESVL